MKKLLFLPLVILLACGQSNESAQEEIPGYSIAFGSCSVQSETDSQLWQEVIQENPDLWIWLGDNIYADTEDMSVMKEKYDLQKSHKDYQQLISQTDVIGIWDDHDFGANDAGSEYPMKDESRDLLFDFLDVDPDNEAWNRRGAYQSYSYNLESLKMKIILLDARYYRDSLLWDRSGGYKKALVNEDGEVLGETQWQWLENELKDPDTDLFFVASGIQVITQEHNYEKWSNFPKERERLLKLVAEVVEVPLVFLSGDRHISEVSKMDLEGYPYPLYDLTSSSLTSPWDEETGSPNINRIGDIIYPVNFAVLDIAKNEDALSLGVKFTGKNNAVLQELTIAF